MQQISPNSRKLLPTISISPSSTSHSSKILTKNRNNESPNNNFTVKPPLDSAMALAVLVLILALFFMGFFSVYMRRLADVSSIDTARRRRRGSNTTSFRLRVSGVGVDPAMIESLPVHVYNGGVEKQEISGAGVELECVICLSEFEERECVKKIPYCGHVFHVECIDTWLMSHVTCPLCRAAKLFPNEGEGHVACGEEGGSGVGEVHGNDDGSDREVRLMVEMNERDGMM